MCLLGLSVCLCVFVCKQKKILTARRLCHLFRLFKKKKKKSDETQRNLQKLLSKHFIFFLTSCVNLVLLFLLWLFKCSTLLNEKRYSGSRTAFINSFININKPLSVKCRAVAAACIIFFINSATTQNMVHIKCVSETTTTNYTWLRQKRNWNWVETIRQLSHAN